ncbi:hypothetical protein [Glycomyces sp. NPDC047010]|uniref:hypothetical protein n=1 Tax=Glycomyces sp. NPDC047010 TaxID=3155023 RepID=UPI0033E8E367
MTDFFTSALPTAFTAVLDFLRYLLQQSETTAAAIAVACAFAVRNLLAAGASAATAAGLLWTGHPVLASIAAAALTLAWLIDCAIYSDRDCLKCGGGGRFKRAFLIWTTSKTCRGWFGCGGSGRKVRLGTRILTRVFGDRFA